MIIDMFKGRYCFLSNFSSGDVVIHGVTFKTAEHAYQFFKSKNILEQQQIRNADTPGQAKRLGRKVTIRDNWEEIKINVMRDVLASKFSEGSSLAGYLLDTGDAELVEGNNWGDRFWGKVDGVGLNWLGRLLMERREILEEIG